jgi:hypothetical protein
MARRFFNAARKGGRHVTYRLIHAQSAEGATQPSPDRKVGVEVSMNQSPVGRDTRQRILESIAPKR